MKLGQGMLDWKTYEYLKLGRRRKNERDKCRRCQWYEISYEHFAIGVPASESELIRLIAMTYSWMPTAALYSPTDSDSLSVALRALTDYSRNDVPQEGQEKDDRLLKNALDCIHGATGLGIVPISKVMHFAFPSRVPMIDSHVAKVWRYIFRNDQKVWNPEVTAKLGLSFPYSSWKGDRWGLAREAYIAYSNDILTWT